MYTGQQGNRAPAARLRATVRVQSPPAEVRPGGSSSPDRANRAVVRR